MRPYAAEVVYNYKSAGPNELSILPGQLIQLAPKEVQQTHKLVNTGWALATVDNKTSGLIPINYVRRAEIKSYANQSNALNEPVISPEIPIQSNMEKQMDEHFATHFNNKQSNEIRTTKIPLNSNELINTDNTSSQLDSMIPADLKDI